MAVDLRKKVEEKAEAVGVSLKKKGIVNVPPMRVTGLVDMSGSMQGDVVSGGLQKSMDQVLGVAMKFDDNATADMFVFDNNARRAPDLVVDDYGTYVRRKLVDQGFFTGGSTRWDNGLQVALNDMFGPKGGGGGLLGGIFGGKKATVDTSPVLLLMFTDGSPDPGDQTAKVLAAAHDKNVYVQMIGVGSHDFSKLDALADQFDHVGAVKLSSFSMSDSDVYDQLVSTEFAAHLKRIGAS